jgi:hypothetical protein
MPSIPSLEEDDMKFHRPLRGRIYLMVWLVKMPQISVAAGLTLNLN